MKTTYILLMIVYLTSCALFKKTTKTVAQNNLRTEKQTYLDKMEVKTANKETHTYTWWNDSAMYQYQHIRERLDEAKTGSLKTKEIVVSEAKVLSKSSSPPHIWLYVAIAMMIIVLLVFRYRF